MKEIGLVMNITELGAKKEMLEEIVKSTLILIVGYKILDKNEIKKIFEESF